LQRNATRKHSRIEKCFTEDKSGVLFPYTICEAAWFEFEELLTKTLIIELRVIAVVARRVDAIILLRIV
jgi:hypothetical protein